MVREYEGYVPRSLSELDDKLAGLSGKAPSFIDTSGYFPGMNIDAEFAALFAGLNMLRGKLGEAAHARMVALATEAKVHFTADPDGSNGRADDGFRALTAMEDTLDAARSRKPHDLDW